MQYRFFIEAFFTLCLTFIFQYYISKYNFFIHDVMKDLVVLKEMKQNGLQETEEYHHMDEHIHEQMDTAVLELVEAMYISVISLLFPINMLVLRFFSSRTNRVNPSLSFSRYIELVIFICLIVVIVNYFQFQQYDPTNLYFIEPEANYSKEQMIMLNVLWMIKQNTYRFDFLLSSLVFFTWMRLIFYFRVSQTFGPMFKIMQEMIIDLGKFLAIWLIIQLMFACVAILAFG